MDLWSQLEGNSSALGRLELATQLHLMSFHFLLGRASTKAHSWVVGVSRSVWTLKNAISIDFEDIPPSLCSTETISGVLGTRAFHQT